MIMSKGKKLDFEEALKHLETLVKDLEREDITLEDSVKTYKSGLELVKACNNAIDEIQKELEIISESQV